MAKEYIERKEAIESLTGWETDPTDMDIEFTLNNLPAADVVEVVRCKDCKHYDKHGYKICALHSEQPDQFGAGVNIYMNSNDFCSYGERMDNNE